LFVDMYLEYHCIWNTDSTLGNTEWYIVKNPLTASQISAKYFKISDTGFQIKIIIQFVSQLAAFGPQACEVV